MLALNMNIVRIPLLSNTIKCEYGKCMYSLMSAQWTRDRLNLDKEYIRFDVSSGSIHIE